VVLDVTAKSPEGTVIFKDSKIYMPQATTYCDEKMVYGAHRKAGYIRDTSLQPFKSTEETFDIKIPEGHPYPQGCPSGKPRQINREWIDLKRLCLLSAGIAWFY
jgi:hypothetical protein